MTDANDDFQVIYRAILDEYLSQGAETALSRAYDLGRDAMTHSVSVLELAAIHHQALAELLQKSPTPEECARCVSRATDHFLEAIAPFEMALRGFLEANTGLQAANAELELLTKKLAVARDQALEASKLKSQFVASISHEIRTPMSAVIGMSDLLLDTSLDREQQELARTIHDSAQSLLAVINDILDFSKIEAGKFDLEIVEFSLRSLVEDTAELLAPAADKKRISLMTFIDPQIPATLLGDPVRLRQILLNLLGNAVKFTKVGETMVRADLEYEDKTIARVRFTVKDTGIGIPASARERLFQPFVQAVSHDHGGTGLGLSICKRLVDLMDGEIGVESIAGQGSTFWFTVDLEQSANAALPSGEPLPRQSPPLSGIRVLVASAIPSCREILGLYLKSWRIPYSLASNVHEGLAAAQQALAEGTAYDVAIVDLDEENTDNFQLTDVVDLESDLSEIKFVLLTIQAGRAKKGESLKSGFSAYLAKPVRQSHLFDCLVRITEDGQDPDQLEAPSNVPAPANPPAPSAPHKMARPILLVEDNPTLQLLALKQINKLGLEADTVGNGREAIDAVARGDYALVLMDCQLPEIDGYEATRTIRKAEMTSENHVAIIAMTASAMEEDRDKCLAAGMDDYLSKPFTLKQLNSMFLRWLPDYTAEP